MKLSTTFMLLSVLCSTHRNIKVKTNFLRLMVFLCLFIGGMDSQAQLVANYGFAVTNTAYTPITGGTVSHASGWDDTQVNGVPLGFDFYFNGGVYNFVSINPNGSIIFQNGAGTASPSYTPISGTGAYRGAIGAWARDLQAQPAAPLGEIQYKSTGGVFTVQWADARRYNSTTVNTERINFQIKLYEGTNVIEIVYGDWSDAVSATTTNVGQVGLRGATNSDFKNLKVLAGENWATPAAGTTNAETVYYNQVDVSTKPASGLTYVFTPPAFAGTADALNFTNIKALELTLNWTDNATGEVGFLIQNSTNGGTTWNTIATTAANAVTYTATGLAASTNYLWRVAAIKEIPGAFTTASQATSAPGAITSVQSGLWSDIATWGGTLPTSSDNVTIADGHTVTQDVTAAVAYTLTVGSGAGSAAILQNNNATTARTLTVTGNVVINGNGSILGAPSNPTSATNHILSIGSDLIMNGPATFNGLTFANSRLNLVFTGNTDNVFTTSAGSSLNLNVLTVNKGTNNEKILEFIPGGDFTAPAAGFLTLTNGTFKLSGTGTIAGGNSLYSTTTGSITASQGIWLNNPNFVVLPKASSPTMSGLLRITQGTYNVGTTAAHIMGGATTSKFIIEGGTMNFSSRLYITSASAIFDMSGGVINVATVGNATTTSASFGFSSATSVFTMSGGTINIVLPSTGSTPYDLYVNTTTPVITGGIINLGVVGTTPFGSVFGGIRGNLPNIRIQSGFTGRLNLASTIKGDLYVEAGGVFDYATFNVILEGNTVTAGNVYNNGLITHGVSTTVRFQFFGLNGQQTYSGTGAFGNLVQPIAGIGVSNADGVQFSGAVLTSRINLIEGPVTGANNLTFGVGGASATTIQISQAASTVMGGTLDVAPTFNTGTGGHTILYFVEPTGRSTGFEIPASRVVSSLSIDNASGITLAGGNLLVSSILTLTTGLITTDDSNVLTAGLTITGGSAASHIKGPLARVLPASLTGAANYLFPIGKAGYNPFELVSPNTTAGGAVTVLSEVIDGNTGGTPGALLLNLNTARYWEASITDGAINFTNTFIRLYDAPGSFDEIAGSSTLNGTYEIVGGLLPTINATSITTTAPAATSLLSYYVMASAQSATISNIVITPGGNSCANVARAITATVEPGASPVASVVINYTINGVAQTAISMTNTSGNDWSGTIPVITPSNGTVVWSITATGTSGLVNTEPGGTYADNQLANINFSVAANPTSVCTGASTTLTATMPSLVSLGTSSTTQCCGGNPYRAGGSANWQNKVQMLVRASELTGLGMSAGNINSLGFSTTVAAGQLLNFTIYMGLTSANDLTTTFLTPAMTNVFSVPSFTATANSVNTHTLTTPFYWDGTSNLVIEVRQTTPATTSTTTIHMHSPGFNSNVYSGSLTGYSETTGTLLTTRPIMQFGMSGFENYTLAWSDGTNTIGTDEEITVTVPSTTDYTFTITDDDGCSKSSAPLTVTAIPLPPMPIGAGATQCGEGVPGAFVVTNMTSGSTNDFRWYDAQTGGTLLQTGGSLYTGSINSTTIFWVSESNGSCESPRVQVTATVNQPDAISAAIDDNVVCLGETVELSVSQTGTTNTYTYTWTATPEAGAGIGTGVPGGTVAVTPTQAGGYTYTVVAVDDVNDCTTSSTVSLTVNSLPVISSVTATPASFCSGLSSTLTALTSDAVPGFGNVGVQSATIGGDNGNPYRSGNGNGNELKTQMLVRASELTAAGLSAGPITSVAFTTTGVGGTVIDFIIKMGHTSADALTSTFETPVLTTVFTQASFTAVVGLNTHNFTTPFIWDGTSNVIVEVCQENSVTGTNTVAVHNPGFIANNHKATSTTSCTDPTGVTVANRPIMRFGGLIGSTGAGDYTWTWTPGNVNGNTITVSPTATDTYSVLAVDPATGCSATDEVEVTVYDLPAPPVTNNSDQCGTIIPTASVSSASGSPTPIFTWYDAPIGGSVLQTGESNTYLELVSQTISFYVSETSAQGCEGPRAELIVSVVEADPITAASNLNNVCPNTPITLTATQDGSNNNYDYTWTALPAAGSGISTEETGNPVTITPTASGTYTYTVQGSDAFSGCFAQAEVQVTISPIPEILSVTASPQVSCSGSDVTLTALTYTVANADALPIGTATTLTGATSQPSAFVNRFDQYWSQTVYTGAELIAAGLSAGDITALTYNITTLGDGATNPNFRIAIKTVPNATVTGFSNTGLTEVYGPATYTHAVGLNKIIFTTPFAWDGVSNILIDVRHDGLDLANNAQTYYSATTGNTTAYAISSTPSSTTDLAGSNPTATLSVNRLNLIITGQVLTTGAGNFTWEWNPGGISGSVVTVNPTANTSYTVTATDPVSGCFATSAPLEVTILELPASPVASPSTQCGLAVPTASVSTGGSNGTYKWYDAETGGNLLQDGGSTYTTAINQTTTFWVSESDSDCESLRTAVLVTVNQPDPITATSTQTSVCLGAGFDISAIQTGNTQNYTYTWTATPETGSGLVNGVTGAIQSLTPTATGTYIYQVTAVDPVGPCTILSNVSVTVNSIPEISSAVASPDVLCEGESAVLTGLSEDFENTSVTLGDSTAQLSTTGSPYRSGASAGWDVKTQLLVHASELQGIGLVAGPITNLGFNTDLSNGTIINWEIRMGHTSATALTATFLTDPMIIVYTLPSLTPPSHGVTDHVFSTPFVWDGVSNIVIETRQTNSATGTARVASHNPGFIANTQAAASGANSATSGSTSPTRPMMYLAGNSGTDITGSFNWVWNPGALAGNEVTVTPTTTTSYTVTATNPTTGCFSISSPVEVTVNDVPEILVATNSTQCGFGIPTASVAGAGGTYNWYDAAIGGNLLQSGSSNTYSTPINSTTTFYVAESNGNCESPRTPVTVTVNAADAVTASVNNTSVCPGTTVQLTATNTQDPPVSSYTYSWTASPEAGSGISTPLPGSPVSVTPTLPGTYIYTVLAEDDATQCATTATVTLNVYPVPEITTISALPAEICAGANVSLSAVSIAAVAGSTAVGAGATTQATYSAPFYSLWSNKRMQILIHANELSSAGLTQGNITSIGFPTTAGTVATLDFSVKMKMTSTTALSAFEPGGFTPVYYAASQPQVANTNNILNLSTPFYWDGSSNVVIEVCFGNTGTTATLSSTSPADVTSYISVIKTHSTTASAGSTICNDGTSNVLTYTTRPRIIFGGQVGTNITSNYNWVWNPGGLTGSVQTVNPTTSTDYSVTVTNPVTGCSTVSSVVSVVVNTVPVAPTANNSTQCGFGVPTASVTGSGGNYKWYSAATGGTLLQNSASATYNTAIDETTTFYVSEITGLCEGPRTPVTVTVTDPDPVTASVDDNGVCPNTTIQLTAVNSAVTPENVYTYTWTASPVAGSGIASSVGGSPASVTPTLPGTYVYTVVAQDAGAACATTATVTVTVHDLPIVSSVSASPTTACAGSPVQLTATANVGSPLSVKVGTATTAFSGAGNPYYRNQEGFKSQILYRASDILAAGFTAGPIHGVSWIVTNATVTSASYMDGFKISMAHTSQTALTTTWITAGMVQVKNPGTYLPVSGVNTHNFDVPFIWDGVSNIVIQTCFDNDPNNTCTTGCNSSSLSVEHTPAIGYAASAYQNINNTSDPNRDFCGITTTNSTQTGRPNIYFIRGFTNNTSLYTWQWNPGAVAGAVATVNPESSTAYTVTATNANGCTLTSSAVNVTVTPRPTGVLSGGATYCSGQPTTTTLSIAATGTGPWSGTLSDGTAFSGATSPISVSVSPSASTTYTIATLLDASCASTSTDLSGEAVITLTPVVLPAPVVSGLTNVCTFAGTGQELTFTTPAYPNASSYNWVVPPTVNIVSGQGTNTLTVTLGAGFIANPNKQIRLRAITPCGTSEMYIHYLLAQFPTTPAPITGPVDACPYVGTATTASYSIAAVDAADSYVWTVPAGVNIVSGQGTTTLTVTFDNTFATSAISVRSENTCGTSSARSFRITRTLPSTPGLISGPTNVCMFMPSVANPMGTPATYSVNMPSNIDSYTWTVPAGAAITNQSTTATEDVITVSFSAAYTGGSISVVANNNCGTSTVARTLNLSMLAPSTPSAIDVVSVQACPDRQYSYTLTSMPSNSTSVEWTIPVGATLVSGQGTTSIVVAYPSIAIAGNVTATANNGCGNSGTRSVSVKLPGCPAPEVFVKTPVAPVKGGLTLEESHLDVNVFPNPSTHTFKLVAKSTNLTEKIYVRVLDNLGREHKRMTMMAGETITLGSELKAGSYFIEVIQGREKVAKRILKY